MTKLHYLEAELATLFQTDPAMWRFLQQGSLDGVWYWDLEDPTQEWMSPEMWRLLGVDPATKTHDPAEWQDLIFQEDLAIALENFEKHCADPKHPYDQIVRYRHADGSTVWVRCRGIAIRNAEGKPIRMLGAHNDLTALKRAEEKLRADHLAADAANEELKGFAYSISHDLKAPSNTLKLLLDRLSVAIEDEDKAPARQFIALTQQTVEQMRILVDGVLNYTRVTESDADLQSCDLAAIAAETVEILQGDIEATGATVLIGALPVIEADAMQMRALLQNLIGNAIKFHRDSVPPEIKIAMRQTDVKDRIAISVQDNGIGIPENLQARIFGIFSRLHLKEDYAGSGLGLALCRRIAVNHGGDISVKSSVEAGSIFTVLLSRKRS